MGLIEECKSLFVLIVKRRGRRPHGFKNQTEWRTRKGTGSWFFGPTEVGLVVEMVKK